MTPKNSAIRDAFFSFGAIQAMQLMLPLLALPWLGRILGPESFGILMYMCLLPPLVTLIMDWGLGLGASRAAATMRGDRNGLASLLGAVCSAKIILAIVCLLGGLALFPCLPHAKANVAPYVWAIVLGICRGTNPIWFYQGLGAGMKTLAFWDICSSVVALILIFLLIQGPKEWGLYLEISAICKGCAFLALNLSLWRKYGCHLNIISGINIIKATRTLFLGSCCTVVGNNGAQLALGYFLSAADMGVIVAVNKMLRALTSLVTPFTQTIYPEICILRTRGPARARKILRLSLVCTFLAMCVASALVCLLAPWLMGIALGKEYAHYGWVLQLMICAAPFLAVDTVLGTQILVPFHKENYQVVIQGCCALVALALACCLGRWLGLAGGALLPVCVESLITLGYFFLIARECPQALLERDKISI